jgi:SnoaL-like protein
VRTVTKVDEATFRTYISAFNGGDYDALVRYYADDVVLSFPNGLDLHGRDEIVDFYRPLHQAVDERLEIAFLLMDDRHIAVELETEFHAREDFPAFPRRPLKAGDVVRILSFVHYDLDEDERFKRIRVGSYRER